jgi:two-component system cell cycle sensor histidine kinase/response regulator CckA
LVKANGLTRRLLAIGRRQAVAPSRVNLNAVIDGIANMVRRIAGDKVHVAMMLAPELREITADASQIEQILLNLAANARDAMPDGGRLTIATENITLDDASAAQLHHARPGAYVLLSVADSGAGIDAETRARIFEPFFTTKEPGKGSGLGLWAVYAIVKERRGTISVDTQPGGGAIFRIYFPALA